MLGCYKQIKEIPTVAVLPTFDMLLFGGTGDLVTRKLLPALYRRFVAGQISADSRIFAMARSALTRTEYQAQAQTSCAEHVGKEFDGKRWDEFAAKLDYLRIDAENPED